MLRRRPQPSFFLALICAAAIALVAAAVAAAQETPERTESVWDGVYTEAQATRGREVFVLCAGCHGEGGEGKILTGGGEAFWRAWGEDSLNSLYSFVKKAMPADGPGTLSDDAYLDVIAYLLQANGLPPGSGELTADRVPGIRVTGKDGPGQVPAGSLVTMVGCVTQRGDNAWVLTNATEPIRTRNPFRSTGVERERAATRSLGKHAFELKEIYAQPPVNQRVEAKGFLVRGEQDGLSVTSFQVLDNACGSQP